MRADCVLLASGSVSRLSLFGSYPSLKGMFGCQLDRRLHQKLNLYYASSSNEALSWWPPCPASFTANVSRRNISQKVWNSKHIPQEAGAGMRHAASLASTHSAADLLTHVVTVGWGRSWAFRAAVLTGAYDSLSLTFFFSPWHMGYQFLSRNVAILSIRGLEADRQTGVPVLHCGFQPSFKDSACSLIFPLRIHPALPTASLANFRLQHQTAAQLWLCCFVVWGVGALLGMATGAFPC